MMYVFNVYKCMRTRTGVCPFFSSIICMCIICENFLTVFYLIDVNHVLLQFWNPLLLTNGVNGFMEHVLILCGSNQTSWKIQINNLDIYFIKYFNVYLKRVLANSRKEYRLQRNTRTKYKNVHILKTSIFDQKCLHLTF